MCTYSEVIAFNTVNSEPNSKISPKVWNCNKQNISCKNNSDCQSSTIRQDFAFNIFFNCANPSENSIHVMLSWLLLEFSVAFFGKTVYLNKNVNFLFEKKTNMSVELLLTFFYSKKLVPQSLSWFFSVNKLDSTYIVRYLSIFSSIIYICSKMF